MTFRSLIAFLSLLSTQKLSAAFSLIFTQGSGWDSSICKLFWPTLQYKILCPWLFGFSQDQHAYSGLHKIRNWLHLNVWNNSLLHMNPYSFSLFIPTMPWFSKWLSYIYTACIFLCTCRCGKTTMLYTHNLWRIGRYTVQFNLNCFSCASVLAVNHQISVLFMYSLALYSISMSLWLVAG